MAINNSARKHSGIPPRINPLHITQLTMEFTAQYIRKVHKKSIERQKASGSNYISVK